MITSFKRLLALSVCSLMFYCTLSAQSEILGTWITPEKDAHIEIYKCSDAYCGKIVWLKEEFNPDGTPRKDKENPDPKLQDKTIMGLVIMKNFKYDQAENEWSGGTVYDSRGGRTYSGYLKMQQDGTLFMKGYVFGMRWLGRSNIWTRVK